jgi:hypothetical protein
MTPPGREYQYRRDSAQRQWLDFQKKKKKKNDTKQGNCRAPSLPDASCHDCPSPNSSEQWSRSRPTSLCPLGYDCRVALRGTAAV